MKRKLSMLLSIILVATSFAGCDNDNVEIEPTTNNTPPPVVENHETTTPLVTEESFEIIESFPIPNDKNLNIFLSDVPDVFKKIGDDISITIDDVSVYRADGTSWDLGRAHEGNLYYSKEFNLLALNLITAKNEPEAIEGEPIGGFTGETILIEYDLTENTVISNDSTEYFADDIDLIVDVMVSIYEYAKTQLEVDGEVDETQSTDSVIDDSSNGDVEIASLADTELPVVPNSQAIDKVDTELPVVPNSQATDRDDTDLVIVPVGQPVTQEILDQLEAERTDPNNYLSYKGSSVMELFAYDVNNYTMADMIVLADNPTNNDIIDALNDYTSATPSEFGYFIKTHNFETNETEKHYVYLDNSNEMLVSNCKSQLINTARYASWTTHMSEENVTSVRINSTARSTEITDAKTAQQIANTLKGNLSVESFVSVSDGKNWIIPTSNTDYTHVYLTFNNGVEYHIQLINDSLQIYTTDLDKTITYKMYSTLSKTIINMIESYV